MKYIKYIIGFFLMMSLSGSALATVLTTNAASDIGTDTVTFHATIAAMPGSGTLYYEYGGLGFVFRTNNQTVGNGATSLVVTDLPLIAGTTYKYRAVLWDGTSTLTGNTVTFTITAITTIDATDYNFSENTQELIDANLDPVNVSATTVKPYTSRLGTNIFWGIFFACIFGFIWLKQEDITLPSMLGILIGATIWSMMDAQFVAMAQSMLVVSLAGLVYSIIKPRS